ncbi:MAG: hypothetical protein L3J75_13580 [Methylococcaceae bacterium]|nr:hypothetical protein [Methylococcaceae bacterium]
MGSVKDQLLKLQIEQLEHDEFFHKEITRLSIHQRLNHMALHFSKYSGKVCDCILNTPDNNELKKVIIDSFIISTTCINTLNILLSDKILITGENQCNEISQLGEQLSKKLMINAEDPLWLVKKFPIITGELAKACESVDHLEAFAYRESIADCVVKISSLMLAASYHLKIDLILEVSLRLTEVKKKSIFFNHYLTR